MVGWILRPLGLPTDALRALQASLLTNPTYDGGWGILNLLIQSGELRLLEDRELLARPAGLAALSEDYLGDQEWILDGQAHPDVLYGTGSIIMDYSDVVPGDRTITEGGPEAKETAAEFLTAVRTVTTRRLIGQGETLLDEFRGILNLLQASRRP
jgi:hypothetical protein